MEEEARLGPETGLPEEYGHSFLTIELVGMFDVLGLVLVEITQPHLKV